ncbi:MAG: hypothetical protein MJ016_02150 [Victivallaceae bacterium]|nr:hypothetical protein [Victivallaceae bacterium]
MTKDKFGRPETSINFGNPSFTLVEWDETTTPDVIYSRGDYDEVCVIQKIDNAAGKISWAYGKWSDRTTLEYGDDRIFHRG